jgi:hypothetical protein
MLDQHHDLHLILEIISVIHLEVDNETPPRIVLFSIELKLMRLLFHHH